MAEIEQQRGILVVDVDRRRSAGNRDAGITPSLGEPVCGCPARGQRMPTT
ncbi:MAG TPA: hypothetical protein VE734_13520 [Terriglobales bacterium]|nr:hypothetical protein [Terriglobales bacterium]